MFPEKKDVFNLKQLETERIEEAHTATDHWSFRAS